MDHLEVNSKVTLKTLEINRTPDTIKSVIGRLEDVYNMSKEYMNDEMNILDMGTKDGLFFDVLIERGFNIDKMVGIDCCTEAVNICKNKGYLVYEGDVQNSLLPENSFDFIFVIHTLEHVPHPEKVVEECTRLLKPNGYIFIEVPIQSVIDEPEKWGHYHPFMAQQQVKDLFEGHYMVLKEDWQKTRSKSPWYRVLLQKR